MGIVIAFVVGVVVGGAVVYIYKDKIQKKVEASKQDLEELYAKAKAEIDELKK